MQEEIKFFIEKFSQSKCEEISAGLFKFRVFEHQAKKILLANTGLGTTFAASIVTLVNSYFKPSYMFLVGTAGGIRAHIKLRDVVIVEHAFEAEIQGVFASLAGTPFESCLTHPINQKKFPAIYPADAELLNVAMSNTFAGIDVSYGTAVTSNTFPAPLELFEKIKNINPAVIDMETSAFYQVAWLLNVPALSVRGVSNVLNHDGTDDKVHESDVKGSANAAGQALLKIIDSLILKQKLVEQNLAVASSQVERLVKKLNLQPHPEGGFYARTFQSSNAIKAVDYNRYQNELRPAGTSIYYLLNRDDFSAWHKIKSDEQWHFYEGSSAIALHVLGDDGKLVSHILGNPSLADEASYQVTILAGQWFSAELIDKKGFALTGCTVSPGFEFKDFQLGRLDQLQEIACKEVDIAFLEQFIRLENNLETKLSESAVGGLSP
jgi:predicted cupin superfamily sugar epimerase/nucleoside phosphorylase